MAATPVGVLAPLTWLVEMEGVEAADWPADETDEPAAGADPDGVLD
jgi:hypothetical protein